MDVFSFFHAWTICHRGNYRIITPVYSYDAMSLESSSSRRCDGPSSNERPSVCALTSTAYRGGSDEVDRGLWAYRSIPRQRSTPKSTLNQSYHKHNNTYYLGRADLQQHNATHSTTCPSRVVTYL